MTDWAMIVFSRTGGVATMGLRLLHASPDIMLEAGLIPPLSGIPGAAGCAAPFLLLSTAKFRPAGRNFNR